MPRPSVYTGNRTLTCNPVQTASCMSTWALRGASHSLAVFAAAAAAPSWSQGSMRQVAWVAAGSGRGVQNFAARQWWGQPIGALANGCHSEELISGRKAARSTSSPWRW